MGILLLPHMSQNCLELAFSWIRQFSTCLNPAVYRKIIAGMLALSAANMDLRVDKFLNIEEVNMKDC